MTQNKLIKSRTVPKIINMLIKQDIQNSKKIGNWLEKQSHIFKSESNNIILNKPNFKRGQIIKVDFGVNMGSELSNTHFAIVLNNDDNNNVDNITVIPLTSKTGYKRLYIGNVLKDFEKDKKIMDEIIKNIVDYFTK